MCDNTKDRWLVTLWDANSQTLTGIGVYASNAQAAIYDARSCVGGEVVDLTKVASVYPRKVRS